MIIPLITGTPVSNVIKIIIAAKKKYKQEIVKMEIPIRLFFIYYFSPYFLINDFPVISLGICRDNNSNIVGAISANFPSFN